MIAPTLRDIGRKVVYRAGHPGAKAEEGVITSVSADYVFVRYGSGTTSAATRREDLEWLGGSA
jgi:hypothetical protein